MTLTQIADVADLLAAFGIIVTLGFLVYEMHMSAQQEKIANWQTTMSGIREVRRRTDDPGLADIIVRGRKSFYDLSEQEQVSFGYWMEEMILAHDPFLVHPEQIQVAPEATRVSTRGAFQEYLEGKGAREWWLQCGARKRWPQHLTSVIDSALAEIEEAEK